MAQLGIEPDFVERVMQSTTRAKQHVSQRSQRTIRFQFGELLFYVFV